jgi:tRNA A-37 threonylcarbamoyl transferase component Bud32
VREQGGPEGGRGRDLSGRELGPYELEARIGGGLFAQVYRARHRALGQPRAVKVIDGGGDQPELAARFLLEAKTAAALGEPRPHPNIVAVLDYGVEGSLQYLVMEYVESLTLAQYLDRISPAQRRADTALRQCLWDVATALDFAHSRGVVHRDVKPANILIRTEGGRALLTDFGIAWVHHDANLTQVEQSVGTYAYMSPEQCESADELTGASDIYGFAAVLYEVAAGAPPFGRGLPAVAGHLGRPVPPLPAGVQGTAEMNAVLARGLAKAPADRYGTASALAAAFLTLFFAAPAANAGRPRTANVPALLVTGAGQGRPRRRPWRRFGAIVRAHRVLAAAVAIALIVGATAAVGAVVLTQPPQPVTAPVVLESIHGSVGTPMRFDGFQVSVLAVTYGADTAGAPAGGNQLALVTVSYTDVGSGPVAVSPYDWVVTDAQGTAYGAVVQGRDVGLPQMELAPQRSVRGIIQFAVPSGARDLVLHFDAEIGYRSASVNLR